MGSRSNDNINSFRVSSSGVGEKIEQRKRSHVEWLVQSRHQFGNTKAIKGVMYGGGGFYALFIILDISSAFPVVDYGEI